MTCRVRSFDLIKKTPSIGNFALVFFLYIVIKSSTFKCNGFDYSSSSR